MQPNLPPCVVQHQFHEVAANALASCPGGEKQPFQIRVVRLSQVPNVRPSRTCMVVAFFWCMSRDTSRSSDENDAPCPQMVPWLSRADVRWISLKVSGFWLNVSFRTSGGTGGGDFLPLPLLGTSIFWYFFISFTRAALFWLSLISRQPCFSLKARRLSLMDLTVCFDICLKGPFSSKKSVW